MEPIGSISPAPRAMYPLVGPRSPGAESGRGDREGGAAAYARDCRTCSSRRYQDGSNDPGVSFKAPTRLSPENAAASVRAHENQHVTRERAKASREGREVVSQSVVYRSAICPECGRVYVSGGTTRTVTRGRAEQAYGASQRLGREPRGQGLDMEA